MLVLVLALGQRWALIPGGIVTALLLWDILLQSRQARAIGYQLREDDLVFRRGILWQRMVAVPYGRMQLVDITHGPLDRGFGIAQLKFVTAAATTGWRSLGSSRRRPRRCATTSWRSPRAVGPGCERARPAAREPAPAPDAPASAAAGPAVEATPNATAPALAEPAPAPDAPTPPPQELVRSPLSDGEWHRLHPLTPLLRGGLFLVVVIGIIVANLRDRLVFLFLPVFAPDLPAEELEEWEGSGDPIDFIVANDLYLAAGIGVLVVLIGLTVIFYLSWRFHTFRITGDDVEVRSGILFRTQRRAPLDRVQGVNLTRPMIARLAGMAKLEVVGAGTDANVKLEYLSTVNAEAVRSDILRLASGRRLADAQAGSAAGGRTRMGALSDTVSRGITGLIEGDEAPVAVPDSVVHIPVLRLIVSHVISPATVGLLFGIGAITVGSVLGTPWLLIGMVPAVIGFVAYWIRSIVRSLRVLDRAHPRRRADHLRAAHDDHRDRAARAGPRGRGLAVGAVARVRLVDRAHQPADGAQPQRLQHRPVHDRPPGRHAGRRRAGAAADPAERSGGGVAAHRPAGRPRSGSRTTRSPTPRVARDCCGRCRGSATASA